MRLHPLRIAARFLFPGSVATLISVLIPASSDAQALERRASSAAEVALAGAGVTSVRSPASLWINPASLVRSRSWLSVSLGIHNDNRSLRRRLQINDQLRQTRDAGGVQLTPAIGLAVPLWKDRLWVGLGYSMGHQVNSFYPATESIESGPGGEKWRVDPGRYLGTEMKLEQHQLDLGAAFRWRWLSVGVSLELVHLRFLHRRTVWAGLESDRDQLLGDDRDLDIDALLEGRDDLRAGLLIGLWARPHDRVELGVAVRLPMTCKVDGTVALEPGSGAPHGFERYDLDGGQERARGLARLDVPFPLTVRAGAAVTLWLARFILEGTYARWSAAGDLTANLRQVHLTLKHPDSRLTWPVMRLPLGISLRDRLSIHVGLEVELWSGFLTARGGYAHHRGGTRSEQPSAVLLDLNQDVLALGFEVRAGRLALSLAFSHSFGEDLEADGEQALLTNLMDPDVTENAGRGRLSSDHTRVILEVQVGW